MGNAFAGQSNDQNSSFYNPGGLPWSKGVMVFGKSLPNNIAAAQAYPTGFGATYGIAIVQTSIQSIEAAASTKRADVSNSMLILSASSKIAALPILNMIPDSQNIGIGANLKYIFGETLMVSGEFDKTGSGIEMDLGGMYKFLPWASVGLSALNILPQSSAIGAIRWNTGEIDGAGTIINTGISAKLVGDARSPIYVEGNEATINIDSRSQRGTLGTSSIGLEWGFRGFLFLRAGLAELGSSNDTSSLGLGMRAFGWGLDLSSFVGRFANSRIVSLSIIYDPEEWIFEKKTEKTEEKTIEIKDPAIISFPSDEAETYDDRIKIAGNAKPGVEVKINNQPAFIETNGNFEAQLPLNPGKNLILIDIKYGNTISKISKKVLRKAKIVISEEKKLEEALKKAATADEQAKIKKDIKLVLERKRKVEALATLGVVEVVPDSEFKLEALVTRGELSSWLVKAAGLPLPRVTAPIFIDVPETHPYAPYIKVSVQYGLMAAIGDKFMPDAAVSKTEAEEIFKKFGAIR
ncbi:S-layer homology domain-containing protein [Candidatus Saganbacteria bacterium]|nr:S-layer homology domain-containing protein [Candidatus Saganbacteria bacterium]